MNNIRLRRFLVEDLTIHEGACIITGGEAKHISKVLRMVRGDPLILMDGKGARFLAEISFVSHNEVTVGIKETLPAAPTSPIDITLCQAVIKSGPMDYLIQKTSELGVNRICPFISSRTVVHFQSDKQQKKLKRWKEIAHSAAKQCNRAIPAKIASTQTFKEQLANLEAEPGIKAILWEGETARDLKALIQSHGPCAQFIGMVGPEGGFSPEEILTAQKAGFSPVSMGARILRSETAAVTLVAIVQYEWGDLNTNKDGGFF